MAECKLLHCLPVLLIINTINLHFIAESLDVNLLTRKLKSVQNRWFQLGIRLDIQYSVLKAIENEHSDPTAGLQMIHMLQHWLQSNPSCSWSTIIEGLREIDENALAETLASTYGSTDQSLEFPGEL